MNTNQKIFSTPPPLTIADLDRLIDKLSANAKTEFEDDGNHTNTNAKRIMYRFWLRTDNEQEQALMQWLDIMKSNRKFQTFVKLALRLAILETKGYIDQSDDICDTLEDMFNKIDWSKE